MILKTFLLSILLRACFLFQLITPSLLFMYNSLLL